MKCCCCNAELDVSVNDVPPKWYGVIVGAVLTKVICAKCLKTDEGAEEYERGIKV
jgi:hypothetical protein